MILVEGQEDVLLYPSIAAQVERSFGGEFFGWGVGGAHNMPKICSVLKDLGFEKVAGILDLDQQGEIGNLLSKFPKYFFACIPAKDIRTKETPVNGQQVVGLLDTNRQLDEQYRVPVIDLIDRINSYLNS
ncbi:MAG: hypothetical protein M1511_14010 [Deltaproteobacteria bacterium]|nr:hypothetical protein [Deltaproteobacteria bacterium]